MTLKKSVKVDLIEVAENGCVQVRIKTAIYEGSEQLSTSFHRYMVRPGDDYSEEDARVRAICSAVHTPEVVAAYKG